MSERDGSERFYEGSVKNGLTEGEIRQIVEVTYAGATLVNRECVICREELSAGDRVKVLPCAHLFHPGCIDGWLTKHAHCPIDRIELR